MKVKKLVREMHAIDRPPVKQRMDNREDELAIAKRNPFVALDMAMDQGHDPQLWAIVKGTPFEREYRARVKGFSESLDECQPGQYVSGFGADWMIEFRKPNGSVVARSLDDDQQREFTPEELKQMKPIGMKGFRRESILSKAKKLLSEIFADEDVNENSMTSSGGFGGGAIADMMGSGFSQATVDAVVNKVEPFLGDVIDAENMDDAEQYEQAWALTCDACSDLDADPQSVGMAAMLQMGYSKDEGEPTAGNPTRTIDLHRLAPPSMSKPNVESMAKHLVNKLLKWK